MRSRFNLLSHMFKILLFLFICAVLSWVLNQITMPPNVVWMNLHRVRESAPYDYIFVGTSHGQYGISPEVVEETTGKKCFNLCMADEYPIDTYFLVKEACKTYKPERIIYELDPSYWIGDQRLGSTSIFFYKEFPWSAVKLEYFADKIAGQDYRSTLFPWSYYKNNLTKAGDIVKKKLSAAYREYDPSILDIPGGYYKSDGFIYQEKVEGADKGAFNNMPWIEEEIRESARIYFSKMVEYCRENQIEIEVITMPVPEETEANMPENYEQSEQFFKDFMKERGVRYHNFNYDPELEFDRSMESYWDYDGHMFGEDAEKFSRELGEYLLR